MNMTLPAPIAAYIAAHNAHDAEAATACFASGAKVTDDGQDRVGHKAIRAWNEEVFRRFAATITPLDCVLENGHFRITGHVTGTFPSSPENLVFLFTLQDETISELRVL